MQVDGHIGMAVWESLDGIPCGPSRGLAVSSFLPHQVNAQSWRHFN